MLFAIIGALLEMIYGMNGTKKRGLHPNNSSILEMSFGGVALDELTGYFLPRVVSLSMIEDTEHESDVTDWFSTGNPGLHLECPLGQCLAINPRLSVSRVQRPAFLSACDG